MPPARDLTLTDGGNYMQFVSLAPMTNRYVT